MKARKYASFSLILLVLFMAGASTGYAEAPYNSYTYTSEGEPLPSPPPYLPDTVLSGAMTGWGDWEQPSDLFVDKDNHSYILDSGNNRIVVLDDKFRLVKVIDSFVRNEGKEQFNNPQGLFISDDGTIYIADTGNARIIVLDKDGAFNKEIRSPESDILPAQFSFIPMKLAVDKAKRLYVVSQNVFEGLMEFDSEGYFLGFTGANRVTPNMIDYIWKRFLSTREQQSAMTLFLPTEFDNLAIDNEGFIYTVTSTTDTDAPIRRQNGSGDNILKVPERSVGPVGDAMMSNFEGTVRGPSTFVDVAIPEFGVYSALDDKRGRIFTYDADGNLLHMFGGLGSVEGTFRQPVALDYSGERILVLDKGMEQLTVFKPTEYASLMHEALVMHYSGHYREAADKWKEVAKRNVNSEIAYVGIGKALLREGQYAEAMEQFKLGDSRKYYSKAFKLYREQLVRDYLGESLVVIGAGLIGVWFYRKRSKHRIAKIRDNTSLLNRILYAKHIMFHPFDGFWDLKHEKRGSLQAGGVLLLLLVLVLVIQRQTTGFIFNHDDPEDLNLFTEVLSVVVPVGLWCVANWCITTLMDGEGTFKDIVTTTAYATAPLTAILFPVTVASNMMTREEGAFLIFFTYAAILWTVYLLFVGMLTVHQYSSGKTVFSMFATLIGMGIILFIALLFFYLLQQLATFGYNLYKEFIFR